MSAVRVAVADSLAFSGEGATRRFSLAWLTAGLLVAVMALLPVYALESGGFQIVDAPIVLLAAVVLFTVRHWWPGGLEWVGLTILAYTLWMVGVEVAWFMLTGGASHLLGMVQKAYALVMLWTFVLAFGAVLTLKSAVRVVLAGLAAAMAAVIVLGPRGRVVGGFRQSLSFNNPDQLAYFALLSAACVLVLLTVRGKGAPRALDRVLAGLVLLGAHYFCFMSVSRSAIGALVVLDAFLPFAVLKRGIERRRLVLLLVVGAVVAVGGRAWTQSTTQADRVAYLMRRFEGETVVSNLNQRLLVRFAEHRDLGDASAMLVGTGKPNNTLVDVKEVHSAYGEALLEGGVVGLALLIAFLGTVAALHLRGVVPRRERLLHTGILAAVMLYNAFLVGTRFRMFWMFLALACAVVLHNERVEVRRRTAAAPVPVDAG